MSVNGAIKANGAYRTRAAGGGGGSVRIECDGLSGNGTIETIGGNGHSDYTSSGGGGGRIAVIDFQTLEDAFSDLSENTGFIARGGSGWQNGGAGTVFLKNVAQANGNLIIDNEGVSPPSKTTLIVAVAEGLVEETGDNTLTDLSAGWQADYYDGTLVNPDVTQGGDGILTDTLFTISTNTETVLTFTDTGLKTVTSDGQTYRGVGAVVDNLEVRGKADAYCPGDIIVMEGDIHSGDTLTFEIEDGSALSVIWLELNNVLQANIVGSELTYDKAFCADCN